MTQRQPGDSCKKCMEYEMSDNPGSTCARLSYKNERLFTQSRVIIKRFERYITDGKSGWCKNFTAGTNCVDAIKRAVQFHGIKKPTTIRVGQKGKVYQEDEE